MEDQRKAKYLQVCVSLTKITWLPIASILLIATGLYFYQLGKESFWIDEFYSLYDAQNIPDQINLTRPLYYFVLRAWMMLGGDSDVWLRSLSIIFALGSIFLAYRLGSRLVGKSVGLITALLMTLSPIFVNHAQEVRMYTLIVFLSLLGTLAFTSVLEKLTVTSFAGWITARILVTLTNPNTVLLLLPDCLLLVWRIRHRRRLILGFGIFLIAMAIVTLLWTLNVYNDMLDFMAQRFASEKNAGIDNLLARLTNFTAYWPLKSLDSSSSLNFYKLYTVMLIGVLAGCFLKQPIGNTTAKQEKTTSAIWLLTLLVILPGSVMFIISRLLAPIWIPRYLLFFAPYLLMLLAIGLVKIQRWQPKLAMFIVVMYAVAVTWGLHDYYTKVYRADWRGAAQMISQQEKANDVIAFYFNNTSRPLELMIEHYYSGNLPINVLTVDQKTGQASLPPFPDRLWLVHNDYRDLSQEFLQQVQSQYEVQQMKVFKTNIGWDISVNVFLLSHKNQSTPN